MRKCSNGESKTMARKEVAQAQDAMLSGKMGACAAHLTKAMHTGARSKPEAGPVAIRQSALHTR